MKAQSSIRLLPKTTGRSFVQLVLPNGATRGIGELDSVHGIYRKQIHGGAHTFNKNFEIGFNAELLSDPKYHFSKIEIDLDGTILTTSREDAVRFGRTRTFQGWERQVFVGIKHFSATEANQPEPPCDLQPALF
jgi:hypothetical protein